MSLVNSGMGDLKQSAGRQTISLNDLKQNYNIKTLSQNKKNSTDMLGETQNFT